ncbi:hypothetical protein QWY81_12030 [Polaribacter undariae]|uniref:Uncharacterized protein n=1 Tax=Polaribacter sejongensis TaxID=985043 RepID=A0AAJ1VHA8_9FLAO|nr:hypothetical protein [Polaribacter undariae]MDN3620184.1 hypothetical protein [Polaribacter undariae]UWD32585.1 hypothetical protein NQP51_02680 [Polaribacter undariae]
MKTVKTIFSVLFLLFVGIGHSQNYKFDKVVKNSFSTLYFPNQEWTNLFNSEDDSYYMQIYNRNDTLVSNLYDTKENKIHYFHIDKSDSLKLYFIETKNMTKNVTKNKFVFSDIKEKKGIKKMSFKILNNKNKKVAKYKFIIKETEKSYFSVFRLSALETQLYNRMKSPMNFIVLEAKGTNISGRFVKYKLESIEDIDLDITIPE